ncbi:MAG: hypothetical protein Q9190_007762 [Brigantiaea leucoxantha]
MESAPSGAHAKRKITRNRELRACTECRRRKLRCDRQLPCSPCVRRNDATCCVYAKNVDGLQSEHRSRLQAEARLEHLEKLVQELSQSQETVADHGKLIPEIHTVQSSRDETLHKTLHNGATHWSAMLEDIEELRTAIRDHDDVDGASIDHDNDVSDATSLLFGATTPLPFEQVLSQFLPERRKADRLVGSYFRMKAVAAPFIHTTQFRRLYQRFWDNPFVTSPLWVSILFSLLEIAAKTVSTSSTSGMAEDGATNRFDVAAAHCLAIGQYYRPQRFTFEALLLYAQAKALTSLDLSPDVAIIFGMLARLATVMGYHRDPDGSRQKMSPFDREMRRRTWSMYMQLDMLVSFQLGLPSNTQFPTWDTRPPTNLLDSDFDEDTLQLPPARPDTEPTELLFYIAKHRLMTVFEKVIRHTLSTNDRPSDELEAIDKEIRDTFAGLPAVFQPRSMTESVVDPPSIKVTRLCVNFIYQKCLCVLHRRYIACGRESSLRACYTSASDLVGRFLDMHKEFEPGGQLETERWLMGSLTWHDFLLGCMGLCLTILSFRHYRVEPASAGVFDIEDSLDLLAKAGTVCERHSARSKDTKKVRRLIEVTILEFTKKDKHVPVTQDSVSDNSLETPESLWYAITTAQGNNDWLWGESTTDSTDDAGWASLEQFLNLPNGDLMTAA